VSFILWILDVLRGGKTLQHDTMQPGQGRSGQVRAGEVRSGEVRSGKVITPLSEAASESCQGCYTCRNIYGFPQASKPPAV
jgi:hypothetical protein